MSSSQFMHFVRGFASRPSLQARMSCRMPSACRHLMLSPYQPVTVTTGVRFNHSSLAPFQVAQSRPWSATSCFSLLCVLGGAAVMCEGLSQQDEELLRAIQQGNRAQVVSLLEAGSSANTHHPLGWPCLSAAVLGGDILIVKSLLEAGADPNDRDAYEYQPSTAKTRIFEFCDFLNPRAQVHGFTPLHYAVISNNAEIALLLLKHNANSSLEDSLGHTPIEYSTDQALTRVLQQAAIEFETAAVEKKKQKRRQFPLEEQVKKTLVGQLNPIRAVAAAIRRKENGWQDDDHPLVFLFLGSSGVGKTELAKQVARFIHADNKKGFIRIDMTEFQTKHEVSKLIGSPPGYIGYDDGGQLTKALKSQKDAVVLFDEVEKAHPDVLNVLLQLFDEGRLTDGQGKTIECKDAIFIMTSNLASDEIAQHAIELREQAEDDSATVEVSKSFKDRYIRPILKRHFQRDEFLGRIDEMLYFVPFNNVELRQLAQAELVKWADRAAKRHGINLTWDDDVLDAIINDYDIHYGARSIQHAVDSKIINKIALAQEEGKLSKGITMTIRVKDKDFQLSVSQQASKKSWFS